MNTECIVNSQVFLDLSDHLRANTDWFCDGTRSGYKVVIGIQCVQQIRQGSG